MLSRRNITFLIAFLLFSLRETTPTVPDLSTDFDEWDSVDTPADPVEPFQPPQDEVVKDTGNVGDNPAEREKQFEFKVGDWYGEIATSIFILWYIINIFLGKRRNEEIALAWARAFACDGGILERNFALLSPGDGEGSEVLMKETSSNFKFYASGRRYCWGFLATLDLRRRQDLFSLALHLVHPHDDTIDIEVFMNEGVIPPMVIAIATPRLAKELLKEGGPEDVRTFAHTVTVAKSKIPNWPSDKLTVLAEHSSVFYDIMNEQLLEAIFGKAAFMSYTRKYFRSMVLSSEAYDKHKNVLRFSFYLPPRDQMLELSRLLSMVMLLIDVLASFRLKPEQAKRASQIRQELETKKWKESNKERQEALLEKKAKKKEEEMARLKTMSPEAKEKYLQKQKRLQEKRQARVKMIRM